MACVKLLAFTGMIINSWNAIGASECDPPFTIFIIGTGKVFALTPPTYLYNDIFDSFAAAFATANETPNIALAPSFDLLGVPSRSIIIWSMMFCSKIDIPKSSSAIISFTFSTAFNTPFPI